MTDASLADIELSGIYQILNLTNGKRYVGSSVQFKRRWNEHVIDLNRGDHHSVALQRAWHKYGASSFKFSILEVCSVADLIQREQVHIDIGCDYNICMVAGSSLGIKATEETRRKLSEAHQKRIGAPGWVSPTKGRKYSREICERMAAPKRGVKRPPFTEAHKANISAAKKGHTYNFGRVVSDETREKIRQSLIGFKTPVEIRKKRCTLTEDQVRAIRQRRIDGMGQAQIAEEFGISRQLVQRVCSKQRYEWVDPDVEVPSFRRKGWKVPDRKRRAA